MLKSFLLSLSSFSLGIVMYFLTIDFFPSIECLLMSILKFILLVLFSVLSARFGLHLVCKTKKIDSLTIDTIQPSEHEVVPNYLGLFVIMLGVGELPIVHQVNVMILLFIIWWLFMEKSYYFNLSWLIFYRYYKVSDENGNEYGIYSRRRDFKKNNNNVKLEGLVRINNFTFIERIGKDK